MSVAATSLLAVGVTPFAIAAEGESGELQLETITVTAQKITERLIDVPIPVSVMQADELAKQNLGQIKDFYTQVPGLSLYSDGNRTLLAIRGITTGVGSNPTVGVTVDDIPIGSSTAQGLGDWLVPDLDPSSLQSVEVLRGPQGMLYGAASMGGLIRYVTLAPNMDETSGEVSVSGNTVERGGAGYGARGIVNTPLIADTLAMRANAFYREDPGFITDIGQGRTQTNVHRTEGGRTALLWQIAPDVSYDLSATYQHRRSYGPASETTDITGAPLFGRYVTSNLPGTETSNTTLALFSGNLKASFGFGDLSSITAFSHASFSGAEDATDTFGRFLPLFFPDGLPAPLGTSVSNYQTTNKFSQELRLSSKRGGRLDWQVGAFYTNEADASNQNVYMSFASTGLPLPGAPQIYLTDSPGHYIEWALFGSSTYRMTDQLDLQLGARYSWQAQHNVLAVGGVLGGDSLADIGSKANAFTYSVTPRWHITPNLMVYGRLATGYRPGGANTSPDVPLTFAHDTTTNYEGGFKGNAIPGLLTLELALFDIEWKDIQLTASAPSGFSYTSNGGTARSDGIEFTAALTPLDRLTITTNLDYNDAKLTRALPANGLLVGNDGDRLPYSAKFTANLAADQRFPITETLTGNVGITLTYIGDRLNEFSIHSGDPLTGESLGVPPRFKLPSYQTVDLRAGLDYNSWNASMYVRNVANKYALVSTFRRDAITLLGNYGTSLVDPRTVGLTVTKHF